MLAQNGAWPEIHEKRFLCPQCALLVVLSTFPIQPVATRYWPHTGLLHIPLDLCPKCTLLHTEGYSQFLPHLCLAIPGTLLMQISPSKPAASRLSHIWLLSSQRNFVRLKSEHITRPPLVTSRLCWSPAAFTSGLCACCSFCLGHGLWQALVPGRVSNLPEVFSDPSLMFPKVLCY